MVAVEPIEPASEEQRFLWYGIDWAQYEMMLEVRGDRAVPRITFVDGVLELMRPSGAHEETKWLIGHLVAMYLARRGIKFRAVASWTLKDPAGGAGLEPDECFIIGTERKPRPDLAIEVIVTSGGIKKLDVYRRLGVREVWFWQEGEITVHVLRPTGYEPVEASVCVPGIDLTELCGVLHLPTSDAIAAYTDALAARR